MEDLNQNAANLANEENVTNDELQTVVQQEAPEAVANDSDTNNTNNEPQPEVAPQPAQEETAHAENETETEPENEPVVDYTTMGREDLLAAFNELMNDDITHIRNRASAIRNQFNLLNKEAEKKAFEAFLAEGGNKDDYHPANDSVAEAFFAAYDVYRARRQKMQEQIDAQKAANLEAKKQILEELRTLIDKDEETLKQTYDEFNAIQDKWKAIGEVPRDQMNDLWQNYHFLIEQFFNKVKINKELRMLDLKRNLEQKIQLCERAEELIVETSVVKAFKALQELRNQWREIGPVPAEQNEETWQRFNNAANQIDQRRREYYDQRKEELDQNLLAKQALIEKATELTQETPQSTKAWNDTTEALDELLKLWKSIGPVPREQNETIWNQFKGIIDKHYADKKLHFGQMRDEQAENYNKKLDLCLRAEAIAKREDWKKGRMESRRPHQPQSERQNLAPLPQRLRRILCQERRILQGHPHQRERQPFQEVSHPRRDKSPPVWRRQGGEPQCHQGLPAPLGRDRSCPRQRKGPHTEGVPHSPQRHLRSTENLRPRSRREQLPRTHPQPCRFEQPAFHRKREKPAAQSNRKDALRPQTVGKQPRALLEAKLRILNEASEQKEQETETKE